MFNVFNFNCLLPNLQPITEINVMNSKYKKCIKNRIVYSILPVQTVAWVNSCKFGSTFQQSAKVLYKGKDLVLLPAHCNGWVKPYSFAMKQQHLVKIHCISH